MNGRTIKIGLHVVSWLLFLILPIFIFPNVLERLSAQSCHRFYYSIVSILLVLFYYFNYYFALPRYYFKQKYIVFITIHVAFVFGVFGLLIFTSFLLGPCVPLGTEPSLSRVVGLILPRHILVFIFSLLMALNERLKAIDVQKTKTELQLLRAQINPHFLFNVLNTIYGQAITKSEHTADSIEKLADLMRYSLKEANIPKVSLEKEIGYLESYISLQAFRLTDKTKVKFQVKGGSSGIQIPPMLLMPFIENAFKYGVSNELETTINITIEVVRKQLILLVENTKLPNRENLEPSNQIGIKNVKTRLDLIYGDRYSLNINDGITNYSVQLKISI